MICKDLMTKNVITCDQDASILEACILMRKHDIGFLPIVNSSNNTVVGVITDRDIIKRAIALNKDLNDKISFYMTKSYCFTYPKEDITMAITKMADFKIKRLIVIDDHHIVGIISLKDLALNKETNKLINELLKEISHPDNNNTIYPFKHEEIPSTPI